MKAVLVPLKVIPRSPIENLNRLKSRLQGIAEHNPDLVVLPECTLTGYIYEEEDLDRFAETTAGNTFKEMAEIARALNTYLCFGFVERNGNNFYDSSVLLNRHGEIVLIQRKMSEIHPFKKGDKIETVETSIGKTACLICGDLFYPDALKQVPRDLDFLIVPMARSFSGRSPDRVRWEIEEKDVYLDAVRNLGATSLLVNSLEEGVEEASFGGAMIVDRKGTLLAESPHGTDRVLVYDLPINS